ncbi:MAG: class I SAM-dependent methyltransferase, partial [Rhizomicrobium sp.]
RDVFDSSGLGTFDVVYSWGVLHHTGDVWRAIRCAAAHVAPGGLFCIAIYNDQGSRSGYWRAVKRIYNSGALGRWAILLTHMPVLFGLRYLWRFATGRLHLDRGMSIWHDAIDWLGGYPFEVASREAVCAFMERDGFTLRKQISVGQKSGCNEFVFSAQQ